MTSLLPDHLRPLFQGFLHEIRNPMSSILTASTLLAEPDLLEKSDFVDLVKMVEQETRRLNDVINQFDRYLHVPAPTKEKFDLAVLLRTMVDELRTKTILDKRVRVVDDLPDELWVMGDSQQIGEAMRAILVNASQAMNDADNSPMILAICPEESASGVVIVIRDSGHGFAADSVHRVFEPFYSLRPGLAGMGLAMALALIENNGGTLEIVPSETENSGACLRVTLQESDS